MSELRTGMRLRLRGDMAHTDLCRLAPGALPWIWTEGLSDQEITEFCARNGLHLCRICCGHLQAVTADDAPYRPKIGDDVTATLRGKLIDYDVELGKWTLETDGTDHVPWRIELHWAQPFGPATPTEPTEETP